MTADESFLTLKTFFESRKAAQQSLLAIKEGVEIGLIIGGSIECVLFRRGRMPVVEKRAALNPDVVFHILPESVLTLSSITSDEIGDIGVNVLKEVLAGHIQIKIPGRLWNLLNRGYIDMIRSGGAPVMSFLAQNGFASITKILSKIKQMRN